MYFVMQMGLNCNFTSLACELSHNYIIVTMKKRCISYFDTLQTRISLIFNEFLNFLIQMFWMF